MYKLLFLDTETTSKDNGRLVQLAVLTENVKGSTLYRPPVPIEIEAMAVHHITNEMVAIRQPFDPDRFVQYDYKDRIIVAHNARFDVEVLRREGVVIDDNRVIDTMRVSQHLIDSLSYSLQYLRYFLNIKFDEYANITPHDAWGDVVVLKGLFDYLYSEITETKKINKTIDSFDYSDEVIAKMLTLSQTPVLIKKMRFGKYKDKTFEEIKAIDIGYLNWLVNQQDLDYDLKFTINYHLTN